MISWQAVALIVVAYLLGSVPSAYLASKWLRGIDIREHGSGNVGGSNVWHTVAHWAVVPVGLFDVFKAALPTWVALVPLELGYPVAVAAGLAAMAGHSWSVYLDCTGGRGLSCVLGTLLVVFPAGLVVESSLMLVGLLVRAEALLAWIGLLALPWMSAALGEPAAVTWGCAGMLVLTAFKRLEANRRPVPHGLEGWKVLLRRLLLDRDVASRREWES